MVGSAASVLPSDVGQIEEEADREATVISRPILSREAKHGMMSNEFNDAEFDDAGIDVLETQRSDVLIAALDARQQTLTQEQQQKEAALITHAVQQICHARSAAHMFELMDALIQDDWLGCINELPGNIYAILAFGPLPLNVTAKSLAKYGGFVAIFLIQLLGPPLICYQSVTGHSVPGPDKRDWSKFSFPSTSDWVENGSMGDAWTTKFVALLFVSCFCLNCLFCHLDEKDAWSKVDRMFNILNYNGKMAGTCECMLQLGAFMNAWVVFWLCIDVYFILGFSETIKDVLMDALGLAFLYNLDDISGDLGFVDGDDWPGLQLAWLDVHIHGVAVECDDISETEASAACSCFLSCVTIFLIILCIVLPVLFIFTPFQAMTPDPFFENLMTAENFASLVQNVSKPEL
eukprot:TRINITY_DN16138_c0_g1_i1.p1 TRINITY_DN16138_c0_g1~~TRINITY_DN16138_c0_g1_i1.p1  ORF type:complete len:429 (+),score=81.36 TRINITY_DN16138_c0_g1_i1:74-1288(+)